MTTDIELRKPTGVIPDAQNMRILATDLFNSKMIKGIENVPQAVAVIQFGTEIGIGPMQALTNIKPIQGQMTMSARLIMGLAASRGVSWKVVESTDKRCEIVFSRPGWESITSIYTIEEARNAGLVRGGSGWEKYPQDMLFARAGSRGIRRIAPDATFGMYSTEEMNDVVATAGPLPEADAVAEATVVEPEQLDFPGEELKPNPDIDLYKEAEEATQSPAFEAAIKAIKDKLEVEGVDQGSFKEWLFGYQNSLRPVKAYCGKVGKVIRFHLGRENDVLKLSEVEVMDKAIAKFRGGKK